MTDHELNGALAEKLGWKLDWGKTVVKSTGHTERFVVMAISPNGWPDNIPNYAGNLNVVHAVEVEHMSLEPKYWWALCRVVTGFEINEFDTENEYSLLDVVTATARQRAEALLEVLG